MSSVSEVLYVVAGIFVLAVVARALAVRAGVLRPRGLRASEALLPSASIARRPSLATSGYLAALGPASLLPLVAHVVVGSTLIVDVFGVFTSSYHPSSTLFETRHAYVAHVLHEAITCEAVAIGAALVVAASYLLCVGCASAVSTHVRRSLHLDALLRQAMRPFTTLVTVFLTVGLAVPILALVTLTRFGPRIEALPVSLEPCAAEDVRLALEADGWLRAGDVETLHAMLDRGVDIAPGEAVCVIVAEGASHATLMRAVDRLRGRHVDAIRIDLAR